MTASATAPPQAVATLDPSKPATDGAAPAASYPTSSFPHLGGGFVGYSAIAYFISWQQQYTYYNELGAPWFLRAFSTTRLLMEIGVLLTVLLLLGVTALAIVGRRQMQAYLITRLSIGFGIVGLATTTTGFIGSRFLSPVDVFYFSQAAIVLFGMSTALIVAGIITGALESGPRPVKLHLWAIALLVSLGLWRAPVLAGRSKAARDAHPQLSALPLALGPDAADSGWRLVAILDRKVLLMKPAVDREERLFRVTENFDAWTARPAH